MARPVKTGLDYFPMDTEVDEKFELIEAKYGLQGFAVIVKLFQRAYREHGYFYPWTEREQILFCRRVNVDINEVNAIINDAVEYGVFDADLAAVGILSSHGMQKRYIEATKRRSEISLFSDILLINADNIPVNVGNNPRRVEFLKYNVCSNTQRKEKKRKEKEKSDTAITASSDAVRLAELLYTLHRERFDSGFTKPEAYRAMWARDIDKLNRIDGRAWADIQRIIEWVKTPGCFWASNILSGKTLREKFPRLIAQASEAVQGDKAALDAPTIDYDARERERIEARVRELIASGRFTEAEARANPWHPKSGVV